MKKILVAVLSAAGVFSLCSVANAGFGYLGEFQAKYPNNVNITCGVCHTSQSPGSSARNPYGAAFEAQAHATPADRATAFSLIEPLDSDGDGYTNLTEITATTATIKVLPGFATADAGFPAVDGFRPIPTRLLFVDNFSNVVLTTVPNWVFQGGTWRGNNVAGNIMLTSPKASAQTFATPNPPVALPRLASFGAGSIEARVQLISVTNGNIAEVYFARTPSSFRYVSVSRTAISIGQSGGTVKRIASTRFSDFQPHLLRVVIGARTTTGSLVRVFVDGTLIGSRNFPNLVAGKVGFRTRLTRARFDDMRVSR
jgi:hypothetical protein